MLYVPGAYCATNLLLANSWSTYYKQHLHFVYVYSYFSPELKTGRHLYIDCRLWYRCHSAKTLRSKEHGEVELKLRVSLNPVLDDGVWSLSCSAALLREKWPSYSTAKRLAGWGPGFWTWEQRKKSRPLEIEPRSFSSDSTLLRILAVKFLTESENAQKQDLSFTRPFDSLFMLEYENWLRLASLTY